MSDKEAVIELVKHLPQNVTLREILQKIEFIAAIREGFDQIDQGQGIPVEQVEQIIDVWTTK
jgi:predicted transcriptional regulator